MGERSCLVPSLSRELRSTLSEAAAGGKTRELPVKRELSRLRPSVFQKYIGESYLPMSAIAIPKIAVTTLITQNRIVTLYAGHPIASKW